MRVVVGTAAALALAVGALLWRARLAIPVALLAIAVPYAVIAFPLPADGLS